MLGAIAISVGLRVDRRALRRSGLAAAIAVLAIAVSARDLARATAAERYEVDWNKIAAETTQHFDALLKIDTSNPPGNETVAAEYLKQVLEREGISAKLLA